MKKTFIYITLVLSVIVVSCKGTANQEKDGFSKTSESFDNFLWKKNIPDTLKAFINTDFSECQALNKPLVLQLCDDDSQAIPPSVAQLYVNGVLSPDNTLSIIPSEQIEKTEVWIVLDESQLDKDRTFTWNLQVANNPGLIRINEVTPESVPWIPNTTVIWKNDHIANSLEVTFWSVLCILVAIFIAILLIMRMQNPAFKCRRMTYTTDDFQKTLILSGAGRVVFSTHKMSQSVFSKLFTRNTIFVVNEFFTAGDVIVTPKFRIMTENGRRNGGRIQARNYTTSNLNIAKDETVEITNNDSNKTLSITLN